MRPERDAGWGGVLLFARLLLRADLANVPVMVVTLFTPLFVLALFRLLGQSAALAELFPAMVGFTVMLSGAWPAQRVTLWWQQGIFERLACTPTPPGRVALAAGLVQVTMGTLQALLVFAVGVAGLGLRFSPRGVALALPVLALGSACFAAYGCCVAGMTRRSELVSPVYMFTVMPLAFLGNSILPPALLPAFARGLQPFLPTAMLTGLLRGLLAQGVPAAGWPVRVLGLLLATAACAGLAQRLFRQR